MFRGEPTPTAASRSRSTVLVAFLVATAVLFGIRICQSPASSSPAAAARSTDVARGDHVPAVTGLESALPTPQPPPLHGDRDRPADPFGEEDGVVPDGATVFDDGVPGVAALDPALLGALRRAATDAADDDVEIVVNSGWRSAGYQDQLLREAVLEHGSEEGAARWVATAHTSAHVSGHAVDVGSSDATTWLSERGAEYGLCQIYRNEPWHYELRLEAVDEGCPAMYADPTRDPRMQQ